MKSTPNAFVDTNVLVYAADERSPLDRETVIARGVMPLPYSEDLNDGQDHDRVRVVNPFR